MTLSKNEQEFIEVYAVAVAKRANAKVEVFKEPTGGFCYKFQPERLRVKDVDDKYTRYINRDRTKSGEYIPLRLKIYRSESWEHSEAADFLMP